jgi:hypothetical protein
MNFLTETIKRFLSKNPSYFKVINIILGITIVLTGLPDMLAELQITLPVWASVFASKTIAVAAIVGRMLTQLTTTDRSITSKDNQ